MITLQELCGYLDNFLQVPLIKDYCKNGLQVEGTQNVGKIATAVTASLATIEAAVKEKTNVLIVHHGLFWNGDDYTISGSKKQKIKLLLDNEISLLAYHLPLDCHSEIGNNWKAAQDLGWKDLKPFCSINGIPIGVKGVFNEINKYEFQKQLELYYKHPAYSALGGREMIGSAALVSGGAYKNLIDAVKEGVDSYITGNFDEPAWHQAFEEKINFFALGHSNTERVGPKALAQHLEEKYGVSSLFIDIENPF